MEKLASNRYFDTKRDLMVMEEGGFFCQACLIAKDQPEGSPDARYCQDCFDFLRKEMETDTRWRHSASMPKVLVDEGTEE